MRVTSVQIRNFRGIKSLDLELNGTTVLLGENNAGKTSVLDALRLCLRDLRARGRVVFHALDFHLPDSGVDPSTADPIQIDVTFSEQEQEEWDDELAGRLNRAGILQVDNDDHRHVRLRVKACYDAASRDFAQTSTFLDVGGEPLNERSGALARLQREMPFFYLTALRDAARHFDAQGRFWRPFLQNSQLSAEKKIELERKLSEVNDLVVSSHASFEKVRDGLRRLQEIVPLAPGEPVSIEAVPARMFDILAKAQIQLGSATGARIPVGRHGEGTQSLAVLMLFSAFLNAHPEGSPIVALEEPEAHLHPSAIRALWPLIGGFAGQKIVSTHSGDLLAETDVHDIRRLARTQDGITAFRVPADLLSSDEARKFNYHIRQTRGELLFARCWLLVEGQTEAVVYPAAFRALGENLHREGVRLVEYRQSDVGLLAKVANALGIEWYCVGDGDAQQAATEKAVRANLGSATEEARLVFPYVDIETHLLENGYGDVYEARMPQQKRSGIGVPPGDPAYWTRFAAELPKKAKTRAAAEVAVEMEDRGESGVTEEMRGIARQVISLARGDVQ